MEQSRDRVQSVLLDIPFQRYSREQNVSRGTHVDQELSLADGKSEGNLFRERRETRSIRYRQSETDIVETRTRSVREFSG